MPSIPIALPDSVWSGAADSPQGFVQAMRLAAALHWYARGVVSQGKAAEIAGISRREFIDALSREHIEAYRVDLYELADELADG